MRQRFGGENVLVVVIMKQPLTRKERFSAGKKEFTVHTTTQRFRGESILVVVIKKQPLTRKERFSSGKKSQSTR